MKQHLVPKLSQWLRDCCSWQPVRYWGVNSLWAPFSFEEGMLQAGADPAEVSDRQSSSGALHPSMWARSSPHATHGGFLELLRIGLSGREFRPPTSLSPKGTAGIFCVVSLYDIVGRGYSCPAGLFAGRAVWSSKCSLKFMQSHEDTVKLSSERLI